MAPWSEPEEELMVQLPELVVRLVVGAVVSMLFHLVATALKREKPKG